MSEVKYRQVNSAEVPDSLQWTTPAGGQGKFVETQYASPGEHDGGAYGDLYMRVIDHSAGNCVTYYKRISATRWG